MGTSAFIIPVIFMGSNDFCEKDTGEIKGVREITIQAYIVIMWLCSQWTIISNIVPQSIWMFYKLKKLTLLLL